MSEPNETQQSNLQQNAEASSQSERVTSQELPETMTREEVQKLIHKLETAEGGKLGRDLKAAKREVEQYKTSYSKLESELTETRDRMSEIQKRIDEAEESEAKDTPEGLKLYQQRKRYQEQEAKLKADQRQLEKERLEHSDELRTAKEAKAEMAIITVAVDKHLDIAKLKEKCERLGLTTKEQITELAETMTPVSQDEKRKPPGHVDSGQTAGSVLDSLKQRYPTMYPK